MDDKLFLRKQYFNLCYIKRRLSDSQAIRKDTDSNHHEYILLIDVNTDQKMKFLNKRLD